MPAGCGRCHAATSCLYNEGNHVAGAEDPEVTFGCEEGGFAAEDLDEAAEQNVDTCCEEDRGYRNGWYQYCVDWDLLKSKYYR